MTPSWVLDGSRGNTRLLGYGLIVIPLPQSHSTLLDTQLPLGSSCVCVVTRGVCVNYGSGVSGLGQGQLF